jgi:hypothetical protein
LIKTKLPAMQKIVLFLFITLCAGLLLTNMYTSIVDAPSWSADIPASIQKTKDHYSVANPGTFFRIFSPANQFMAFLTLVFFWHTSKKSRVFFGLALVLVVLADVMTFMYFYPRNAILFEGPLTDATMLRRVSDEWKSMNWVRTLIVLAGLVCAFLGLDEVYKREKMPVLTM